MTCKICSASDSFELFDESFNKHGVLTKTFICRNCFILYNPTSHSDSQSQEKFESAQGEVVSTYYTFTDQEQAALQTEIRARAGIIEFLLADYTNLKRGTLIDIGTGSGTMAIAAADYFDWVYASDLDITQALKTARITGKRNVSVIKDFKDAGEGFDVAIMWHTMEHLFDPGGFIQALQKKMNPGGVLFCQIPSFKKQYLEDSHVWFYNPASIKRIKEIFGFSEHRIYFDPVNEYMAFLLIM